MGRCRFVLRAGRHRAGNARWTARSRNSSPHRIHPLRSCVAGSYRYPRSLCPCGRSIHRRRDTFRSPRRIYRPASMDSGLSSQAAGVIGRRRSRNRTFRPSSWCLCIRIFSRWLRKLGRRIGRCALLGCRVGECRKLLRLRHHIGRS